MSSIYNGRSSILKNLRSKSTHKSIKTQLIEHGIEWKAIIITLIEMSARKRKQLTLDNGKVSINYFNAMERKLKLISQVSNMSHVIFANRSLLITKDLAATN